MNIGSTPISQTNKSSRHKIFPILGVLGLCLIASLCVRMLIKDRITYADHAETSITNRWGGQSVVFAPALVFGDIPNSTDLTNSTNVIHVVEPDILTTTITFKPEKRSYGIFNTVVYTATAVTEGSFAYKYPTVPGNAHFVVPVKVTSSDQIQVSDFSLGNKAVSTSPVHTDIAQGDNVWVGEDSPEVVTYAVSIPKESKSLSFSYTTTIKGSKKFAFDTGNTNASITVSGAWDHVGFAGKLLPDTRTISKEGFEAKWTSAGGADNLLTDYTTYTRYIYNQIAKENSIETDKITEGVNDSEYTFEINFLGKSDTYVKTDRATKYAILFISLTFLILFLFEILKDSRIHPMQYFFIGAGLAIFYLLLLAFSEHVGFFAAYLIASIAIITVSTWYTRTFLREKKNAWLVTGLLVFLYAFMYFLLQLRDYTLLAGTLFVFIVLIVTMYTTRKVDWYGMLGSSSKENN